jgi:hypothetical protein
VIEGVASSAGRWKAEAMGKLTWNLNPVMTVEWQGGKEICTNIPRVAVARSHGEVVSVLCKMTWTIGSG